MDNVTNIEPADNEERLLKGILEGDTETNIEPAGNKERLLKGILENLGGGGGGATSVTLSGDNLSGDISLADLKAALSNGVVLLSFPTDGNADERVVAEYTDDSTNGLRIGVFSEDEYIVYSVVDDGNDGVTLTVESEKGLPRNIELTLTSQTGGTIDNTNYTEIKKSIENGAPLSVYNPALGGTIRVLNAASEPTGELKLIFQQYSNAGGRIQSMTLTEILIEPNTPTQWSIAAAGTFVAQI